MSKRKKAGTPFNNLQALAECKEHFMSLCKMYDHMGKLFALQARAMTHPMVKRTSIPQTQLRIVEQFNEVGEEMKNIGAFLDLLGGKPVMKAEEPEAKKVDVKVEEESEKKKKTKKEEYVSNIAPEKKEEKE